MVNKIDVVKNKKWLSPVLEYNPSYIFDNESILKDAYNGYIESIQAQEDEDNKDAMNYIVMQFQSISLVTGLGIPFMDCCFQLDHNVFVDLWTKFLIKVRELCKG